MTPRELMALCDIRDKEARRQDVRAAAIEAAIYNTNAVGQDFEPILPTDILGETDRDKRKAEKLASKWRVMKPGRLLAADGELPDWATRKNAVVN